MVFSSNAFLFLFLPAFMVLYYLTPKSLKNLLILIASYAFYAWWRIDFLALFIAITLWNYGIAKMIHKKGIRSQAAYRWLTLGVIVDLSTLGYFKYANFGVESFNAIISSLGIQPFETAPVLLPIGVSFYIFHAISYIVDVYRGDAEPTHNLIDFAAFVALFPQQIAGPVLRYKDLAHQFVERTHSLEMFYLGSIRFIQGFIKKVFIADSIAPLVSSGFGMDTLSTGDAWVTALAYTAQLYFDFSGYSDMAIGLGMMMGFRFNKNFNQPYVSQSITEFWRRWHISLSNWLRDYLYIPLGGNRQGVFNTYRNLFLTMLLGGFWHGANWTFVLWGTWHGGWLVIEKYFGWGKTPYFQLHRLVLTFFLVVLGWVMFRAENVTSAMHMYEAMFLSFDFSLSALYAAQISLLQLSTLVLAYGVLLWQGARYSGTVSSNKFASLPFLSQGWASLVLLTLFGLSLMKLSADSYSPFLYFQF